MTNAEIKTLIMNAKRPLYHSLRSLRTAQDWSSETTRQIELQLSAIQQVETLLTSQTKNARATRRLILAYAHIEGN